MRRPRAVQWLPVGIAIGAAMGVATHRLAIGVALGIVFGLSMTAVAWRRGDR